MLFFFTSVQKTNFRVNLRFWFWWWWDMETSLSVHSSRLKLYLFSSGVTVLIRFLPPADFVEQRSRRRGIDPVGRDTGPVQRRTHVSQRRQQQRARWETTITPDGWKHVLWFIYWLHLLDNFSYFSTWINSYLPSPVLVMSSQLHLQNSSINFLHT